MNGDTLTYGNSSNMVVLKDREGEWKMVFNWDTSLDTVLLVCIDYSGRNSNSTFELGYMGETNIRFPPEGRYQAVPIQEARQHWYTLVAAGWKTDG